MESRSQPSIPTHILGVNGDQQQAEAPVDKVISRLNFDPTAVIAGYTGTSLSARKKSLRLFGLLVMYMQTFDLSCDLSSL